MRPHNIKHPVKMPLGASCFYENLIGSFLGKVITNIYLTSKQQDSLERELILLMND